MATIFNMYGSLQAEVFMMIRDWICCQLGAREHYAIPRALHRANRLDRLLTDCWVKPRSLHAATGIAPLSDRYHQDLGSATVSSWTMRSIAFEAKSRLCRLRGWN